jgi:hypothetical protein
VPERHRYEPEDVGERGQHQAVDAHRPRLLPGEQIEDQRAVRPAAPGGAVAVLGDQAEFADIAPGIARDQLVERGRGARGVVEAAARLSRGAAGMYASVICVGSGQRPGSILVTCP